MHWVDRGPEPDGVSDIKERHTPKWVSYYEFNVGNKPQDSHWRKFFDELYIQFYGLCGYCERECLGEVDHFRPKNKYPELVYNWNNWILACHSCNLTKGQKWSGTGYVNPCATSRPARPENFFDFDVLTGMLIPKRILSPKRYEKAVIPKGIGADSPRDSHI